MSARGCEKCGGDSKVIRTKPEGRRIVRERECKACGTRWETVEERQGQRT